ncbi:hypothetical protein Q5424_17985 [Conexibacter sp. JD483]|uniref:hypothetical protein n=1 Tax=unclassified Conexibacter TaxID=2627773 RepID=UPI002726A7BF|nr:MULTISPECIES: hypothetical protein [unclassified Conexibacter]MDO8188294.1 hypothetical protein [Conexibacter sp. CPCC 205706]MDO8198974.1 hypothetical protein [Conexibacter sp. CPCC 205762]MDR9370992.1 hypothetical protein [Conexibacter sp. JD483]
MRTRTGRRHFAAAVVGAGFCALAAGSAAQAADRAYELVTPPGSSGKVLPGSGMATPSGDVVCFDAENALADAPVNGEIAPDGFCSRRTPTGWETQWVTGPAVAEPRGGYGAAVFFVSPDGSRAAFGTDKGISPDWGGDPPGQVAPGTQSAYLWEGGGAPRWLAPTPDPIKDPNVDRNPIAASDDVRYGLFQSGLRLVPQDTNSDVDVYEWTPNGIRLVSRDANGAAAGGEVPRGSSLGQAGVISRDGSRVFFQHVGPLLGSEPLAQNVFMLDGDELRDVSPRRGGDVPGDVIFVGATGDGETVFLQTSERLTPEAKEAGNAVYRYDVASDRLTLAATDPMGANFLGFSADGSTLVTYTDAWDLQVVRDAQTFTLGALDALDIFDYYTVGSPAVDSRGLRIAPDGSSIAFSSLGSFDGEAATGYRQVYRWTPAAGVQRISATPGGAPAAGDANIGNWSVASGVNPRNVGLANTLRKNPQLGRVIADDGSVFFESAEQLVPADVNAYVDVYEWRDGVVRLISPGTQRANALYMDNSDDGSTVFFVTSARLIPELDRNDVADLYAARVGGGFPLPATPPACEGDRCQGPLATPSAPQTPGTSVFEGPGDELDPAPKVARLTVTGFTAKQRRAFARSGRIVLRVRANERGVVTATGRARIGRRTVRVARSVAAVRSGGTARLSLSLSRQARAVLRSRRRLRVTITVAYSESATTVRREVTLRG